MGQNTPILHFRSSWGLMALFIKRLVSILLHRMGWLNEKIGIFLKWLDPFFSQWMFQNIRGERLFCVQLIWSTGCLFHHSTIGRLYRFFKETLSFWFHQKYLTMFVLFTQGVQEMGSSHTGPKDVFLLDTRQIQRGTGALLPDWKKNLYIEGCYILGVTLLFWVLSN